MCGEIYNEAAESVKFVDLPDDWVCPVCGAPKTLFEPVEEKVKTATDNFAVPVEGDMAYIQHIATRAQSLIEPAGARESLSPWSEVLLLPGQLAVKPLAEDVAVVTETIIGRNAKKPMKMDTPIIVSHMSYGALTGETKVAIARGAKAAGVAVSSGEGGLYEPELDAAGLYIFEIAPHKYSLTDQNLQRVDAVEIKIGQSAKPGLGGHLTAAKVTAEIAAVRGVTAGQEVISPPAFDEINSPDDLKSMVDDLRQRSGGRPIGVKLAASNIEADLEWVKIARPDFVTIDGRGGGTGAAPRILRDATGVPTLFALHRARKFLDENKLDISLIITGGLRTAADFAKCLALGADAIAVATSILTALAASGDLPAEQKVENYLRVSTEEIKMFAKACGLTNARDLSLANLATVSHDVATYTDIKHV
jgi:glutamate synthase domain-containing protein 2/rubredoxin